MLGLLVLPLWTFYLLRDEPQVSTLFYRLIPPAYRADAESIQALVNLTLGSYLRGQLILCLSVGIMFTLGLLLLGVDYALLLGTIAGILEVVPALGPFLGTIPAVLVALATSPSQLLKVIVLALAVQQIENTFLVPQVTGETVNLHPALVMLLLVVGSAVGGIWGVILSVPLTALIRDLVHYLYLRLADEPLAPHAALARVRATHSA
jgi:predicted PurR-regulated permease PerM